MSEQHATAATTGRRSTGTLGLYVVGQLLVVVVGGSIVGSALGDGSGNSVYQTLGYVMNRKGVVLGIAISQQTTH